MNDELSFRSYHNPIIWAVIALTVIALLRGVSELYLSDRLNSLIIEQNQDVAYNSKLTDLSLELTEAETGQRGYLITSNTLYLTPYNTALNKINQDISYLKSSSTSSRYKSQITNINKLTSAKLNELKQTINTLQAGNQAAAFAIVNTGKGQSIMSQDKAQINYILDKQADILEDKQHSTKDLSNIIAIISPFGLVLNLGLIYLVLYLARQAILKERRLEGTREQFVTVASHQLRTPATAVKQYIYLLLDGYYGRLSNQQRSILKLINMSNERGISVANSLLSVTRADAGEINISDEPVNLNNLLMEVINHYKIALKHNKQQQIIAKLPKKPIKAYVDPFYIKMVFDNLIDNASKYSAAGKRIDITLKQTKNNIVFSVKDQGIGISQKDISKLFRKFARLNSSFRINSEGSGLGLYLVKKLVDLHGGTIEVTSVSRKGSTFTVKLKRDRL